MHREHSKGSEFLDSLVVSIKVQGDLFKGDGQVIRTPYRFLEGDMKPFFDNPASAKVRKEVKDLKKYPVFLKDMAEKGARLLITKDENWLVVHSKESLEYSNKIQEPKVHEVSLLGKNIRIETHFHPFLNNYSQTEYTVQGDPKDWKGTYWEHASLGGGMAGTDPQEILVKIMANVIDWATKPPGPAGVITQG